MYQQVVTEKRYGLKIELNALLMLVVERLSKGCPSLEWAETGMCVCEYEGRI